MDALKNKVEIYERLLHTIHMHRCITMDGETLREILDAIDGWSFAHECGNGEQTDDECGTNIDRKLQRLATVAGY